ncbi:MAG TPA: hypothetical protein VJB87_04035 [Candidatus Nanoarchaeia archaeon]|nr:hypothetical protein [Candidatus Nanoarchaeia archaeon]
MGLFSKKKEPVKPELPKFPEFPQLNTQPTYQPEFSQEIKELPHEEPHPLEVNIPVMNHVEEDLGIPIRKPFQSKVDVAPPMTTRAQPAQVNQSNEYAFEKPLFIKVDDYREAIGNIEALKRTLQDTEALMEKLDSIRLAEEEELKKAHDNIEAIKEQLLFVDKRLFEV